MHSVRNAIAYGRVVLAPIPQADPRAIDHYEGVDHLIAEGTAEAFDGTAYGSVLDRVRGSYARALDADGRKADHAEERTLGL